MIKAGVDCLKIEGRMKSPEYVATVVSIYRKYLDNLSSTPSFEDKEDSGIAGAQRKIREIARALNVEKVLSKNG